MVIKFMILNDRYWGCESRSIKIFGCKMIICLQSCRKYSFTPLMNISVFEYVCERMQSYLSWLHPTFKTSKVCADYLLRLFARVCTNSTVSTTHINASHARRGFFSTAMTFFYFAHTYIVSMKFAIWKHIVATLKLSYCL